MNEKKFRIKKFITLFLVGVLTVALIFPKYSTYEDGGTKTYTSIIYKVIVWHSLDNGLEDGYKTGIEIHFFPHNFKSLDDYK